MNFPVPLSPQDLNLFTITIQSILLQPYYLRGFVGRVQTAGAPWSPLPSDSGWWRVTSGSTGESLSTATFVGVGRRRCLLLVDARWHFTDGIRNIIVNAY